MNLNKLFPDNVSFLQEAESDFLSLDHAQQIIVAKAIRKVSGKPAPVSEGGYGKPLGNRAATRLAGYLKIKIKDSGLRVVYQFLRTKNGMKIIIIGVRSEEQVYREAVRRIQKTME